MNDRRIRSQEKLPFNGSDSYTTAPSFREIKSAGRNNDVSDVYKAIMKINDRLDSLEEENKLLHKDLNETRTRENKLLNRFSWLIQIINIGSVVLLVMAVVLFIDAFYPFVKKIMDSSIGATIVIGLIGGAIGTGIISIWWTFNKYVQDVIKREKQ